MIGNEPSAGLHQMPVDLVASPVRDSRSFVNRPRDWTSFGRLREKR
jgi:hypothetical protein